MKRTHKECDACGARAEWGDDHLPADWAILTVAGKPLIDLCPECIAAPTLAAAERRKKA